ncbi:hypothetical protein IFHNHDMJ_02904 [Synechococcus sp. CBW1107]|nr:hypothetical protein IFHNHDMJ_02904 [Synechococcus sp. CBW1107]
MRTNTVVVMKLNIAVMAPLGTVIQLPYDEVKKKGWIVINTMNSWE